jgi:ATP-dependent DNA helicase RecQ
MPKSIEHYQQETGRAGRDGLEAECVLFYTTADYRRWQTILSRRTEANGVVDAQLALLNELQRFCTGRACRHRGLSLYFGQSYESGSCGACDVCLDGRGALRDGDEIARRVLACVQSLKVPFGVTHVVDVLVGAKVEKVTRYHHDALPEYGALKQLEKSALRDLIFQRIDLGYLDRSEDDRPVLRLTRSGSRASREREPIALTQPLMAPAAAVSDDQWEGVDRGLFEALRQLRRTIAEERGVPAFIVFGDATLRDLARQRPTTPAALRRARGVGEQKLVDLGDRFLAAIGAYAREHRLPVNLS